MKPIFKKLIAIGRGVLKGAFPGVSGAIEAAKNIKGVEVTVTTPDGQTVTGIAKPHSWYSIVTSIVVGVIIIYGMFSNKLSVTHVVELIKYILEVG